MWLVRRLIYLLIILAILYALAWFGGAWFVKNNFDTVVNEAAERGVQVQSEAVDVTGFPMSFIVELTSARVTRAADRLEWIAPERVAFGIDVLRPFTGFAQLSGVHRFSQAGSGVGSLGGEVMTVNVDSERLAASVNPLDRTLKTVHVDVPAISLRSESVGALTIKGLTATLGQMADSRVPFDLNLELMDLPSPFSSLAAPRDVAIKGDIFPQLPISLDERGIAKWQRENGLVTISALSGKSLDLSWKGEGQMSISPQLQPNASLTTRIKGVNAFTDRLVDRGLVADDQIGLAKFGLALFTRPAEDGIGTELVAPLVVQNGVVKLGPLDLVELPKVTWPR